MSKHENAGMYGVAKVLKTDNGYRGVIENHSERGLWEKGEELFNRQLHPYAKGTLMNVTIRISKSGRKMVQRVEGVSMVTTREAEKSREIEREWRSKSKEAPKVAAAVTATGAEEAKGGKTLVEVIEAMGKVAGDASVSALAAALEETDETATKKESSTVATKRKPKVSPTDGYYVSTEARMVFSAAHRMSKAKPDKAVKVMMVGESGYGKTTLPKLFASLVGMDFVRMNCATIRDPEEWFGYREAIEGSTVFIRSHFAKALEKGNLVVVLDEFNRLEPWLHNTLFPLLDDDGCTVVHDEKFVIGPNVIVVGTINTGHKYTGIFELDEALLNRFEFILEVGPMEHHAEVKVLVQRTNVDKDVATAIVKMATALRNQHVVCSTRTTLLVASMVTNGLTPRQAYEFAVVRRIPSDSVGATLRKSVVDSINSQLGVFEEQNDLVDVFESSAADSTDAPTTVHHYLELNGTSEQVGMLALISIIRKLPLVTKVSIREAQNLAESIAVGVGATLELTGKPDDFEKLTKDIRSIGVGGKYYTVRL